MTDLNKIIVDKLAISTFYDARGRNSFCWKYFGHLVLCEANKKKLLNPHLVYCSACLNEVKSQSDDVTFGSVKVKKYNKTVSTGNLTRHLRDDHHIQDNRPILEDIKPDIKELFASVNKLAKERGKPRTSLKTSKVDKFLLAKDMALWFCKSILPFDYMADDGMKYFFKKYSVIVADDQLPSLHDVSGPALTELYENMLKNVEAQISSDVPQHCAMTFDLWTDQLRRLEYITFKLHYLTCDFEMKVLTLNTQIITERNNSEKIGGVLEEVKKRFGLENKKIHAVTDAGNIIQAVLLGNMEHHLCLGHALHNLVTADGINTVPEITALVKKCKDIVKTVRNRIPDLEVDAKKAQLEMLDSFDRVGEMLDCDDNDPITQSNLTAFENPEGFQDANIMLSTSEVQTLIPSRWHVILELLELCNQDSLNTMVKKLGKNDLRITKSEGILLGELVNFLKRFREIVEIMSFQNSCTMNVALVFRSEIIDILNSVVNEESSTLLCLKQNMLVNIDKRFPVTQLMVAAALLDNRFMGLKMVDSYLESRGMNRASFLASYVKEIVKTDDITMIQPDVIETSETASTSNGTTSFLQKLSKKHSVGNCHGTRDDPVEQECWRYLAASDPIEPKDGNLLSFWNDRKMSFPRLSALAKSLLCVPAISTSSERLFSEVGLQLSNKRSRLSPSRANKIIFIHNNYKCTISDKD